MTAFCHNATNVQRIAILIVLLFFLPNCAPLGDAGVIVKGQLLTVDSEPYSICYIKGSQGDEIIFQKSIKGFFETTIIFSPDSNKPLALEMSCENATETYVYVIEHLPKPYGEILDVGSVILE